MNRSWGVPSVRSPAFRRPGPAKAGTPNSLTLTRNLTLTLLSSIKSRSKSKSKKASAESEAGAILTTGSWRAPLALRPCIGTMNRSESPQPPFGHLLPRWGRRMGSGGSVHGKRASGPLDLHTVDESRKLPGNPNLIGAPPPAKTTRNGQFHAGSASPRSREQTHRHHS